ncbi:MAG: ABC transporter permease [Acidobacteriia bacterium]|nr:ABC transporter permease [Terriglobia bacterium]
MMSDVKFALRSLRRVKGLAITVVLTLALGIGANAAIFSIVRGVLLRPLVNKDEAHLIYIRQSAPGVGTENTTFSVPEIDDLRAGLKNVTGLCGFSTIGFTMVGLGDPQQVRAGVVDGAYFETMGLRPVLGRLINAGDDGPSAAGVAVLTHRFWSTTLHADPNVIGTQIRLGTRSAAVVGVLEPSVPYPSETELIANVVTSPHHLSATMVTGREHRMTEVFGRLAPGTEIDGARAELTTVYNGMIQAHPEAYQKKANFTISAVRLRDQITSKARTVLLVLLAASALMFVIACSNVANLILARTVRRESELAVRTALGASTAALRRTLLAESLVLCGAGGLLGVAIAQPMVTVLSKYAARFSIRALDLQLDWTMIAVGVGLALSSAVLLAFVPRLPTELGGRVSARPDPRPVPLLNGSPRTTSTANRKLRAFAVVQVAACFMLLAGAGMLLRTLIKLQASNPGFETRSVLAVNVPVMSFGKTGDQIRAFYRDVRRRVTNIPGVAQVAVAGGVPWRDSGLGLAFTVEGWRRGKDEDDPQGRQRSISPGYFAALNIPLLEGRDFNDADRNNTESVVIVSAALAQRLFPGQSVLNRHLSWTDPIIKFIGVSAEGRRVVGVAADINDEQIGGPPMMIIYQPFEQATIGGRLLVHARTDPYALVPLITKTVREMAADQPIERAATLEDVRAEVLSPNRLNTIVFGGFAAVALAISIVGVAGVLAFSVSGRMREFGIRMAIGSQPRAILASVLKEGAWMAGLGVIAGAVGGFAMSRVIGSVISDVQLPGPLPTIGAALVLLGAAIVAAVWPAARAARVDVVQALRAD